MKKLLIAVLFAACFTAIPARAQVFGNIVDAPQHAFAAGFGVGPTSKDWSGLFGYAEKLTGATYSFSGVSLVPAIVKTSTGASTLSITPVMTTGVKQILYQQGRFTLAADASAGVSTPSTGASGFNFAGVGAVDFLWRLNKVLNVAGGTTNNYIAVQPTFTQLTGSAGQTVISIAVAWVHGVN